MNNQDIVVWDKQHWCYFADFEAYGRNRSHHYTVLVVNTEAYHTFLHSQSVSH